MIKSNINITSNIYIRSNPDIKKDKKYIKKIVGPKLLKLLKREYSWFETKPLTDVQEQIIKESAKCHLAKSNETSYGVVKVNDDLKWVNRCEYTNCRKYDKCIENRIPKYIERQSSNLEIKEENDNEEFDFSNIIYESNNEHNKNIIHEEIKEKDEENTIACHNEYIKLTSPDCIITSSINSHIMLNSGPGTGKTYTIIQRIIYILSNNLCDAEEIYILCYTRSAKEVILNKIKKAVKEGTIPVSAQNICILTFDSYATYFLIDMKENGIISENFKNSDYNERIQLFNKYISTEDFEGIKYFIVDEIQDLVNERALMVINILKNINCGFLLAGDKCQSIYDFEADGESKIDSMEFYKLIDKYLPQDIQKYEIIVNKRQEKSLADIASKMRNILLNTDYKMQDKYLCNIIQNYKEDIKIKKYIENNSKFTKVPTAILCRSNGEAEYINGLLCKNKIPHTLNRGVNNTSPLPKWIADIFFDYCLDTISKTEFTERFYARSNSNNCNNLNPEQIWSDFFRMMKSQEENIINTNNLFELLKDPNNIPSYFYEKPPLLTVSTVHKAKGMEFENVIMTDYCNNNLSDENTEEARIKYVAFTRPKNKFILLKKDNNYFRKSPSGHCIMIGFHRYNKYCRGVTIGLNGDIETNSFISGDFDSAIERQEYIVNNIKKYDKLTAVYSDYKNSYNIMHNNNYIGSFSASMIEELINDICATDYKNNLPESLDNIYVNEITTEILDKINNNIPDEFQKSKIFYGIEITGFAKLNFPKR